MGYTPPLISGPIAPENNPPINPQYYQPRAFPISALTLGPSTLVTTSVNHNYVIGQLVRLLISQPFGSYQINEQQGYVISIPAADQVIVTINSTLANPFINNMSPNLTPAQIIPIGDVNTGVINATGRINNGTSIPGSFINISPFPK